MENEIALLPPKENAIAVFTADKGLDPYLAKIRAEIDSFVPDVTTKKGRDAIASIAYKVAKSKTALDNLGKELVAELKDVPRKIDAERKRMRDTLDAWKDEVRKPLTDFELAEEARVYAHKNRIAQIRAIVDAHIGDISCNIQSAIETIENKYPIDPSWEEFLAEASQVKTDSIQILKAAFSSQVQREAEQAELARLREEAAAREQKEREERIAREAAESARIAAEQAAAAERQRLADEQARKDAETKEAIERAEREKIEAENARLRQEQQAREAAAKAEQDRLAAIAKAEAEKQAAIEAERQRQADAQEAERLAAEQREKNKAHAKRINNEALQDLLTAGLTEEMAKAAITAIAKGNIRNVSIKY